MPRPRPGSAAVLSCSAPAAFTPRSAAAPTCSWPCSRRWASPGSPGCGGSSSALLAALAVLRAGRGGLRRGEGAELAVVESLRLGEQRRRLLAHLAGRQRVLPQRHFVGERGIPRVKPGGAVVVRDQRLLIADDRVLVAQAEFGIDPVLAGRARDHQLGEEADRLIRLHRRLRITTLRGNR